MILSITPFGLTTGPWPDAPATEFTIQAESGSIGARGRPGSEPFQAGGRIAAWTGGCFAAVAALAAIRRAPATGRGEHIDFSLQEVTALVTNCYLDLMWGILGRPPIVGSLPNIETPSIEPTARRLRRLHDLHGQQMSDFLLLIERPDLRESGEFDQFAQRLARLDEWEARSSTPTRGRTRRMRSSSWPRCCEFPWLRSCNGQTVLEHEQVKARGSFVEDPSGGFQRPVPPYRIDGRGTAPPRGAAPPTRRARRPDRMAHEPVRPRPGRRPPPAAGRHCASSTRRAWWGGADRDARCSPCSAPTSSHVESVQRIDGRPLGGRHLLRACTKAWWECSFIFLSAQLEQARHDTESLRSRRAWRSSNH